MANNERMTGLEFREFFIEELKDIYWAEEHLAKALPRLRDAATSRRLMSAMENYLRETEYHIQILDQVFGALGERSASKRCRAMEGLLQEADEVISDTETDSYTRDAALIMAGQKVEHYKIATYGTLRIFARHMGEQTVEVLLTDILENAKDTDLTFTLIAEDYINERASME